MPRLTNVLVFLLAASTAYADTHLSKAQQLQFRMHTPIDDVCVKPENWQTLPAVEKAKIANCQKTRLKPSRGRSCDGKRCGYGQGYQKRFK